MKLIIEPNLHLNNHMKQTTVDEIKQHATKLVREQKVWHFHILTPECLLNDKDNYALMLENTSGHCRNS